MKTQIIFVVVVIALFVADLLLTDPCRLPTNLVTAEQLRACLTK